MANPSRKEIWKMFDTISGTYDRTNRLLSFGMDRGWRKQVAHQLRDRENLKILDLATGTGDQLISLFENGISIRSAVGIDLAAEMLKIAEKKIEGRAYQPAIQLQVGDAEKIPFEKNSFDAATFSFGIRNVTHPLNSLKEIYRVLKPAGKSLILEFSLPPKPIRLFYLFYLRHLLPRIGGLLSRKTEAYRYLNQTIETFPYGKSFCTLMKRAGFEKVQAIPLALGSVTLYIGEKG